MTQQTKPALGEYLDQEICRRYETVRNFAIQRNYSELALIHCLASDIFSRKLLDRVFRDIDDPRPLVELQGNYDFDILDTVGDGYRDIALALSKARLLRFSGILPSTFLEQVRDGISEEEDSAKRNNLYLAVCARNGGLVSQETIQILLDAFGLSGQQSRDRSESDTRAKLEDLGVNVDKLDALTDRRKKQLSQALFFRVVHRYKPNLVTRTEVPVEIPAVNSKRITTKCGLEFDVVGQSLACVLPEELVALGRLGDNGLYERKKLKQQLDTSVLSALSPVLRCS